jgi:hypothetical protein
MRTVTPRLAARLQTRETFNDGHARLAGAAAAPRICARLTPRRMMRDTGNAAQYQASVFNFASTWINLS